MASPSIGLRAGPVSRNAVYLPVTLLRQAETSVNTWRPGTGDLPDLTGGTSADSRQPGRADRKTIASIVPPFHGWDVQGSKVEGRDRRWPSRMRAPWLDNLLCTNRVSNALNGRARLPVGATCLVTFETSPNCNRMWLSISRARVRRSPQFSEGLSIWSITNTSTGPLAGTSFKPSCS